MKSKKGQAKTDTNERMTDEQIEMLMGYLDDIEFGAESMQGRLDDRQTVKDAKELIANLRTDLAAANERAEKAEADRDRLKEYEPRLISFESGEFKIAFAKGVMQNLVEAFSAFNGDANYTESYFENEHAGFICTIQTRGKHTPHELRRAAEAERDTLRTENAAMREERKVLRAYIFGLPQQIREKWSFDGLQLHTHNYHSREDFIQQLIDEATLLFTPDPLARLTTQEGDGK